MAAALLQRSSAAGMRAVSCSAQKQHSSLICLRSANQRSAIVRPFTSQRTAVPRLANVSTNASRQVVAVADLLEEENVMTLPKGYDWYETMLILKPTLSDEQRDKEIAKFEAFLNKEECFQIDSLVRGRSSLAYPMKKHWEGQYVLYTFAARRPTAKAIQQLLSNPDVGSEDNIMRFMVFRKSGRR